MYRRRRDRHWCSDSPKEGRPDGFGSREPTSEPRELRNATMGHWARVRREHRTSRAGLARLALALVVLAGLAGTAVAQGVVKSVHGDWQIRCDTPPGAQSEQCALIQSVTAEDRPNVGLSVIVLKTADQKSRLLRVLAPLGVLLPNGLGLRIDSVDVGKVSFVRCLPHSCVAER